MASLSASGEQGAAGAGEGGGADSSWVAPRRGEVHGAGGQSWGHREAGGGEWPRGLEPLEARPVERGERLEPRGQKEEPPIPPLPSSQPLVAPRDKPPEAGPGSGPGLGEAAFPLLESASPIGAVGGGTCPAELAATRRAARGVRRAPRAHTSGRAAHGA